MAALEDAADVEAGQALKKEAADEQLEFDDNAKLEEKDLDAVEDRREEAKAGGGKEAESHSHSGGEEAQGNGNGAGGGSSSSSG
ncbi:unnamed protein product, partial [Discosporangium mesarthrocarpum]